MKHITTLISEKVLIDQESKLVSIIDITEKLNVDINTKKNPLPEKEKLTINTNLNLLSIWFREDVKMKGSWSLKLK